MISNLSPRCSSSPPRPLPLVTTWRMLPGLRGTLAFSVGTTLHHVPENNSLIFVLVPSSFGKLPAQRTHHHLPSGGNQLWRPTGLLPASSRRATALARMRRPQLGIQGITLFLTHITQARDFHIRLSDPRDPNIRRRFIHMLATMVPQPIQPVRAVAEATIPQVLPCTITSKSHRPSAAKSRAQKARPGDTVTYHQLRGLAHSSERL